jgi:competence protein ComEC
LVAVAVLACGGLNYDDDDDANGVDDDDDNDDATYDPQNFGAHFYNVGLGDATLLQIPGPYAVLIDGGPFGAGDEIICPDLQARGIDRLDALVMTHPDFDHCSGLAEVFACVDVDEVWLNTDQVHNEAYDRFRAAVDEWGGPVTIKQVGDVDRFGDAALIMIHADIGDDETDNNGLVFGVVFGALRALFTADVRGVVQQQLADQLGAYLNVDLVKIPAHGLAPFSQDFIDLMSPTVAVLMVGENDLGYPSQSMLDAYEASGALLLRTDVDGYVDATFVNDALEISTEHGE